MIVAASFQLLWRTQKPLIIMLLIAAPLLVGILGYRHLVAIPRLATLEKNYLQRQAQVRLEQAGRARNQGPAAEFQRNLEDFRLFDEKLPQEHEFSELIGELDTLAAATGLNLASINYQTEIIEESGILAYSLQFSLQGSYAQVKRFLHSLEMSRRLITIDSLGLSGGADGDGALRLKVTTYFKAEES
ncbi:MAG: type 4a pilus biogenesis protein PilO [Desulfuromonadales bacterium]|nr:type 4a pilus biogenesis protein PilO [Desulfuromonadales bacterium]MDT8423488.1 type 4a pilus biogenesis protein PilO [Desulfuromonadales bacterium]